jgi:hypothetical protein
VAATDLPWRFAVSDAFTSDTYNALCTEAEEYLSRGLVEQAREHLLKAVSLIGTRPRARSLLADCCMALGLWSEAREQLEQLTTLEINNAQNHYRLGQVLEELGEYELAKDNYQVVVDFDPSNHGASVAIARLAGKVPGATRAAQPEKPKQAPPAPARRADVQIFPDVPTAEDVFATTEDLDNLLKDIGVAPGSGRDSDSEVADLLNKVGINLEPAKKTEPVVEKPPVRDISDVLGTGDAPRGGLEALFTTREGQADSPPPPTPAMQEQKEFSLESIFNPASKTEAAAPSRPAAPAAPPKAAEAPPESIDALFGISGEAPGPAAAPAEEAPPAAPSAISLDEMFSVPEQTSAPEAPVPPAMPAAPAAGPVVEEVAPAPPGPEAISLETVFGAEPEVPGTTARPSPKPAEPPVPPAEPLALESVFEASEPAMAQAPAAEAAVEPPQGMEGVLESVFPAEQPAEPAEVQKVELEPAIEAAPAAADAPVPEPSVPEAAPGSVEPSPVEVPAEPAAAGPSHLEAPAAETPAPAMEIPEPPAEAEAPAVEAGPASAEYVIHKPGPDELLAVHLQSGELEVRLSFLVATDGSLSVREDGPRRLLGGSGIALLGQGSRVPVVVTLSPGCLVRADRLAAFDSLLAVEEGGVEGLPGLASIASGACSAVLFATGRFREVRPGDSPVKVRTACLLAAETGITVTPDQDNADFCMLTGNGRAVLAL